MADQPAYLRGRGRGRGRGTGRGQPTPPGQNGNSQLMKSGDYVAGRGRGVWKHSTNNARHKTDNGLLQEGIPHFVFHHFTM